VADAPVECGVWPTLAAQVGPYIGVCCDLPRNRPPFLRQYDHLHQADFSLLLNKKGGSKFGLVQRSDGTRHFLSPATF
jgi:hypothetical protein